MPPQICPGSALILCGHRQGRKVAFLATFFFVRRRIAHSESANSEVASNLCPVCYSLFAIRAGFPTR